MITIGRATDDYFFDYRLEALIQQVIDGGSLTSFLPYPVFQLARHRKGPAERLETFR